LGHAWTEKGGGSKLRKGGRGKLGLGLARGRVGLKRKEET